MLCRVVVMLLPAFTLVEEVSFWRRLAIGIRTSSSSPWFIDAIVEIAASSSASQRFLVPVPVPVPVPVLALTAVTTSVVADVAVVISNTC